MKTDYKNLSVFEGAAVVLIIVGLGLICFQIFISLPQETRIQLALAMQVFEMSDAIEEVVQTQQIAHDYVFGGMEEFYNQFYVALNEALAPVGEGIIENVAVAKRSITAVTNFADGFMELADYLASSYSKNYAGSGVEASAGGKVMGAFFEKLSQ